MTAIDLTSPQDAQVQSLLTTLRTLSEQVKVIDKELGTDDQGPVAKRNRLAAEKVAQYSDNENFKRFLQQVTEAIEKSFANDPNLLTAVVTELDNQISEKHAKTIKTHLDAEIAKQPTTAAPTISEDRKTELAKQRANVVGLFKLHNEMLKYFDGAVLPNDIEVPSARRGAIGPRGPKFIGEYAFFVNGEPRKITVDKVEVNPNLSQIAMTVTKDLNWKTKDLKDFIIDQLSLKVDEDKNTVNLPAEWEVTLPMPVGKTLKGVLVQDSTADDSDDGDDSDNGDEPQTEETLSDTQATA